jgi:hypothetical protein
MEVVVCGSANIAVLGSNPESIYGTEAFRIHTIRFVGHGCKLRRRSLDPNGASHQISLALSFQRRFVSLCLFHTPRLCFGSFNLSHFDCVSPATFRFRKGGQ